MSKPYVPVRAVMTHDPLKVDGMATVRQAVDLMHAHSVSSVIIDKRFDGDEYGMLVITDIAREVVVPDRSPDRTSVYEIMSKPILTVEADMDIKYAIRMLQRFDLSRALVVEGGRLVGIVTLRDLVFRHVAAGSPTSEEAPENPGGAS